MQMQMPSAYRRYRLHVVDYRLHVVDISNNFGEVQLTIAEDGRGKGHMHGVDRLETFPAHQPRPAGSRYILRYDHSRVASVSVLWISVLLPTLVDFTCLQAPLKTLPPQVITRVNTGNRTELC